MHIYLLVHKSDVIDHIKDYDRKILNKTGKHLQIIQSDGGSGKGGEFFNHDINDYCQMYGIHQRSSTAYTPEQNGRAERGNRTVLEGTSSLLIDSNLDLSYWGFAAKTFVYLKNRSPHAALYRSTPYQVWFGKQPDLSHLHVFGTRCWSYIPSKVRKRFGKGHKLISKSQYMIHVGYSDKFKAWTLFDPVTKLIVNSNDVIWEPETSPPTGELPAQSLIELVDAYEADNQEETGLRGIMVIIQYL
jgi:hypothetical protein